MPKIKNRVYALMLGIQKSEITNYCIEQCKKIDLSSALTDDELGALGQCRESECPVAEKELLLGKVLDGKVEVYLRKLKPVPK